jgi:hypothetical protein
MRGRTFDDLRFIVLAGGSLDISARGFTEEQLRMLALAAAAHNTRLTFRDLTHLTTENLRHIAIAGKGCVTFGDQEESPAH